MKKLLLLLIATVSLASAGTPGWGSAVHIKEIWIAPGPTSVVRITTDEVTNQYFTFYVSPTGNPEMLTLAQKAMSANIYIKIFAERDVSVPKTTGLSAPNISSVDLGCPLYSLAIAR